MMTERLRRTMKLAGRLAGFAVMMSAVSACGVKNLPVAPQTGKTPNVIATEQRSGDTTLFGGSKGTAVRIDRISSIQSDNVVSAAAVTRNTDAPKRPFILDPLLN